MKLSAAAVLLSLSATSNAFDHIVSHAQLSPDQRELDRLHDAYNVMQELQMELTDQIEHNAVHRELALGDALICRFQLASCQTLTATANVELWVDKMLPMENSTTFGPLFDIVNQASTVTDSLASLADLGTLSMVLDSADSVLAILSQLTGNMRNARESSFDTMSAMESMDVIVQETGVAFNSLGAVWTEFWGAITSSWENAKRILLNAYAVSETMFVTMYRDVIKASASFMMTFWTTTIEFVTTASSQQKMACPRGRIECSYETWTYEMFPSLATLSVIGATEPVDSNATEPVGNATLPEPPVGNATAPEPPVVDATEPAEPEPPVVDAAEPEPVVDPVVDASEPEPPAPEV